eukprot:scaffold2876_cov99-Amphora_coffeaeformis.AAC.1
MHRYWNAPRSPSVCNAPSTIYCDRYPEPYCYLSTWNRSPIRYRSPPPPPPPPPLIYLITIS